MLKYPLYTLRYYCFYSSSPHYFHLFSLNYTWILCMFCFRVFFFGPNQCMPCETISVYNLSVYVCIRWLLNIVLRAGAYKFASLTLLPCECIKRERACPFMTGFRLPNTGTVIYLHNTIWFNNFTVESNDWTLLIIQK